MTGERPTHLAEGIRSTHVAIERPRLADGSALWRIARDSTVLDLNSSYAYVLWARDFAETTAIAKVDGAVAGFVTGYLRPDQPDTLFVWQVAVDEAYRGAGIAGKLLRGLLDRLQANGVRYLETTITSDNEASIRLFSALARDRGTEIVRDKLFTADVFPDGHDDEDLYRIGPFAGTAPS